MNHLNTSSNKPRKDLHHVSVLLTTIKEYISNEEVPQWILDIDKSNCELGKVYNIYACKKCMIEHVIDKIRKDRILVFRVKKKIRNKVVCGCKEKLPIKLKFKICYNCGWHVYGKKVLVGKCHNCATYTSSYEKGQPKIKKRKFYRMGELVESYHDLEDKNAWNCGNRNECLDVTKNTGGSIVRLGCKNCPYYLSTGL